MTDWNTFSILAMAWGSASRIREGGSKNGSVVDEVELLVLLLVNGGLVLAKSACSVGSSTRKSSFRRYSPMMY